MMNFANSMTFRLMLLVVLVTGCVMVSCEATSILNSNPPAHSDRIDFNKIRLFDDLKKDPKYLWPPCEHYANGDKPFQYPHNYNGSAVTCIPTDLIRFSQRSVSSHFTHGKSLDDVIEKFEKANCYAKKKLPTVIKWNDEIYQSIDNRRIFCAKKAGIKFVPAIVYPVDEPLPRQMHFRFSIEIRSQYFSGKRYAQTWGEGAIFRSLEEEKQMPVFGTFDLPSIHNTSSTVATEMDNMVDENDEIGSVMENIENLQEALTSMSAKK